MPAKDHFTKALLIINQSLTDALITDECIYCIILLFYSIKFFKGNKVLLVDFILLQGFEHSFVSPLCIWSGSRHPRCTAVCPRDGSGCCCGWCSALGRISQGSHCCRWSGQKRKRFIVSISTNLLFGLHMWDRIHVCL